MATQTWSVVDIPDQRDTTVVLTGAHVVLAVRSAERGQTAAAIIRGETPRASLEVMVLDLAELASILRFATGFRARYDALPLLINRARVGSPTLQRTPDGFEPVVGTNQLGHFALSGLLHPALLAAPGARVVTVASMAHATARIAFDSLDAAQRYRDMRAHTQRKLVNLVFAYELQRRLAAARSAAFGAACHPGWAATNNTVGPREPAGRLRKRAVPPANPVARTAHRRRRPAHPLRRPPCGTETTSAPAACSACGTRAAPSASARSRTTRSWPGACGRSPSAWPLSPAGRAHRSRATAGAIRDEPVRSRRSIARRRSAVVPDDCRQRRRMR